MSKSPLTLAALCLTLGTLSAQTIDTWVTSQGAMFEASVKTVVPGQVTFILKDGREQPVPLANLSDRSRAKLIEFLGLGTASAPAPATVSAPAATPAPPTTPAAATSTTPTTPAVAPAAMTPATAPVAGAAIEATDIAQINALIGQDATLVGTVTEVVTLGASGHKLIKFDGTTFNIFISKQMLEKSTDWILDDLPGKRLQVSGKLESYRDAPQVNGLTPSQLVRVQ
jgi:hypothetical protein